MSVILRPGESQEALLKRFRKEVTRTRILSTHRKKRWFVSKGMERRREREKAIRRLRRKQSRGQSRA
jgi:small subunit ribosomal protein S21